MEILADFLKVGLEGSGKGEESTELVGTLTLGTLGTETTSTLGTETSGKGKAISEDG